MQILVLGPHRSGTSMITRLINMMGAYVGPEKSSLGFGQANPKGFWERKDVMQINDKLLALRNCTWNHLTSWNLETSPEPPQDLRRSMRALLLDMDAHRPWVMKDPRMCLTLPCWQPFLEVPVAVLAFRDPLEVARSLAQRNSMPIDLGLAVWEYHAVGALNASLGMPRTRVTHAQCLHSPMAAVKTLYTQFQEWELGGLRLPSSREILAFVEPKLYRAKKEDTEGDSLLSPQQRALAQTLLQGAPLPETFTPLSDRSFEVMAHYMPAPAASEKR